LKGAQLKQSDGLTESEKALSVNIAKRLLELRAIVMQ